MGGKISFDATRQCVVKDSTVFAKDCEEEFLSDEEIDKVFCEIEKARRKAALKTERRMQKEVKGLDRSFWHEENKKRAKEFSFSKKQERFARLETPRSTYDKDFSFGKEEKR